MNKIEMLNLLAKKISRCEKCEELANTRTQTIFDRGNPNAKLVFLGEAGGKDEDRQGKCFVGKAGKLLDNILTACNLTENDVYICNILKCHPPNNRVPTEIEASNCRKFLDLQLKVVSPKFIICLGSTAAQRLLNVDIPISQMRGNWYEYNGIKVMATFHPAYALRNSVAKHEIYKDIMTVLEAVQSIKL
jgi:DNA polymerase